MDHLNGFWNWIDDWRQTFDHGLAAFKPFEVSYGRKQYFSGKDNHLSTYPFFGLHFFDEFWRCVSAIALSGFTKDSDTLESLQANLERHGEDSDPDLCAVRQNLL